MADNHCDRHPSDHRHAVRLLAGLACLVAWAAPAAAGHHEHEDGEHGAEDGDVQVIEVVTTNVQGKNIFIPSTVVLDSGKPAVLSIYNTTEIPHGFKIVGLGIEFILPAKQEFEVKVPALEGNKIYKIECQLHPPHRSAQLVVIDAD